MTPYPPMLTDALDPAVNVTSSEGVGTPEGDQLLAVVQSPLAPPTHTLATIIYP